MNACKELLTNSLIKCFYLKEIKNVRSQKF